MTDHQAQARALLLTLIEYLDLSVKEPERWPNLESILAAALQAERAQGRETAKELADAAEMLWIVLANVSGGDWTKQTAEWQDAAARYRDKYLTAAHPPTACREQAKEGG